MNLTNYIFGLALALTGIGAVAASEFDGITIGVNSDWKPYSYEVEGGAPSGVMVDEISKLLSKRGVKAKFVAFPWKRVQRNVEDGTIDAFVTVPTDERLKYSLSSKKVVYTVNMKSFVNQFNPRIEELRKIKSISEFRSFKVCDLMGNGWAEKLYKEHSVEAAFLTKTENCVRHVHAGRSDIMIIAEDVGKGIIEEEGLADKLIVLPTVYNKMEFTFLVSKHSKHQNILELIDRPTR